jgi:hypothetical protein
MDMEAQGALMHSIPCVFFVLMALLCNEGFIEMVG